MISTLDSKRRLTVPKKLTDLQPGQAFEARYDAQERTLTFRLVSPIRDWFRVLKSCPVPMDDVPPRSRELPKRVAL